MTEPLRLCRQAQRLTSQESPSLLNQSRPITATLSTDENTVLPPLPLSWSIFLSPISIIGIPSYLLTAARSTRCIARKPTNSVGLPLQSGSVKTARSRLALQCYFYKCSHISPSLYPPNIRIPFFSFL